MPRKKKEPKGAHPQHKETSEPVVKPKAVRNHSAETLANESSPEIQRQQQRQFYWAIGIMVVLLIVFFGAYYWFKVPHTFNYEGLTFTPEDFGGIPVYHYSYSFTDNGKPFQYNLYLREDPRKNNVPYEGEVEYPNNRKVYIAVDTLGLENCSKLTMAVGSLSMFIANNQIEVKGAIPDKSLAEEKNQTFANCSSHPNNPVVLILSGEETRIQRQDNCYKIFVARCEVLPAVEKFILRSVIDARNYALNDPKSQQNQPASVRIPLNTSNISRPPRVVIGNQTSSKVNFSMQ